MTIEELFISFNFSLHPSEATRTTVQFQSIRQSRVTGLADETKFRRCHRSQRQLTKGLEMSQNTSKPSQKLTKNPGTHTIEFLNQRADALTPWQHIYAIKFILLLLHTKKVNYRVEMSTVTVSTVYGNIALVPILGV